MNYKDITEIESLLQAWNEFKKGKREKYDVQLFERNLEDNLFELAYLLRGKVYKHSGYEEFYVSDPKRRHIHKAEVQDRIVHHVLYKYLYELFDKTFIFDSYSCRLGKGTHKGVLRLRDFARTVSRNYTRSCWALKFDIKKFFANVDHKILMGLLSNKVKDPDIIWLLGQVINSFHSETESGAGIPLGNLTSQIFANICMNELDRFIKQELKIKYYLRYADDFVMLSGNKESLEKLIPQVALFLREYLKLDLHPNKIIFRRLKWGIDFLGYIVLPDYCLPRTKTVKRMFKKLKLKSGDENFNQSVQSYLGYLSHANSYKITQKLKNQIWLWFKS